MICIAFLKQNWQKQLTRQIVLNFAFLVLRMLHSSVYFELIACTVPAKHAWENGQSLISSHDCKHESGPSRGFWQLSLSAHHPWPGSHLKKQKNTKNYPLTVRVIPLPNILITLSPTFHWLVEISCTFMVRVSIKRINVLYYLIDIFFRSRLER